MNNTEIFQALINIYGNKDFDDMKIKYIDFRKKELLIYCDKFTNALPYSILENFKEVRK